MDVTLELNCCVVIVGDAVCSMICCCSVEIVGVPVNTDRARLLEMPFPMMMSGVGSLVVGMSDSCKILWKVLLI